MLEAFLLFTSTKIGKIVAIIVIALIAVFSIFMYSNLDSIKEKFFGIDSKATLQAKLAVANTGLDQCVVSNKLQAKAIENNEAICNIKLKSITNLEDKNKEIDNNKNKIIADKKKAIANIKISNQSSPVTQEQALAKVNINSIWLAYCADDKTEECRSK